MMSDEKQPPWNWTTEDLEVPLGDFLRMFDLDADEELRMEMISGRLRLCGTPLLGGGYYDLYTTENMIQQWLHSELPPVMRAKIDKAGWLKRLEEWHRSYLSKCKLEHSEQHGYIYILPDASYVTNLHVRADDVDTAEDLAARCLSDPGKGINIRGTHIRNERPPPKILEERVEESDERECAWLMGELQTHIDAMPRQARRQRLAALRKQSRKSGHVGYWDMIEMTALSTPCSVAKAREEIHEAAADGRLRMSGLPPDGGPRRDVPATVFRKTQ
jgi:hypothetical protein